jgi:hypothetical protein
MGGGRFTLRFWLPWNPFAYHRWLAATEWGHYDTVMHMAVPKALVTDLIAQYFKLLRGIGDI